MGNEMMARCCGWIVGLLAILTVAIVFVVWSWSGPAGIHPSLIPSNCEQVVVVTRPRHDEDGGNWLYGLERGPNGWSQPSNITMPCAVWYDMPHRENSDRDYREPDGVYRIGIAFGREPSVETKLQYRQTTDNDYWVDDPDSPQYNHWVTGKPAAKVYEKLRPDDGAYELAAVIEYNTDPVVPGRGGASFLTCKLHLGRGIQVDKQNLEFLLRWLDKDKHPVIVIKERDRLR
jgi:L,D-peptidoglycan transpeptidase YkuD (ErfK/YbiS/YcfS/YnhG family)